MSGLGEAVMITWAEYGLKIENTSETTESLVIYVSVPEHSCKRNAKGSEMAAMDLAKRFKTVMTEMGVKRLTVKAAFVLVNTGRKKWLIAPISRCEKTSMEVNIKEGVIGD